MHKWTMFALFCAAILLGLSILFTTIPAAEDDHAIEEAEPAPDVELDVAAAETVYSKNCLMCHGAELQGGGGPKLADIGARLSQDEIAGIVQKGKGAMMPSFKDSLSAAEIGNLAKWLSEMK
jgi:cytochrome c550